MFARAKVIDPIITGRLGEIIRMGERTWLKFDKVEKNLEDFFWNISLIKFFKNDIIMSIDW